MAAATPPVEAVAAPKSRKGLYIALVLAVVLLAAVGGGAAWYFMQPGEEADAGKGAGKAGAKAAKGAKSAKAKERKPAVFVPLDPFTVNLQGPGRENYLQVGLVLEAADAPAADAVKLQMPVIRGQILLLLAAKSAEELSLPDGKDRLAAEMLAKVRQPLPSSAPLAGIEAVHYSAFIIQ